MDIIKLHNPSVENPEDYNWKWFSDALRALDRTHVSVCVPLSAQGRYRNRKQQITTNMFGVCDET